MQSSSTSLLPASSTAPSTAEAWPSAAGFDSALRSLERLSSFRRCTRCTMDTTDPGIAFDADGACHHCRDKSANRARRVIAPGDRDAALRRVVERIRAAGTGRDYDCVVGVSGGVDSTYVAWLAKGLGLSPLAVHFDNGWNSELAVSNIEGVLQRLGIELYTYVVDWEEFRDLQLSFLRASTPDGEIPSDHAIYATLMRVAREHGIRTVLSGMNYATESISVPSWAYGHSDWRYIRGVHERFGSAPLKTFPHYSPWTLASMTLLRRTRFVSILNYVDYRKGAAKRLLQEQLGWRDYGGKHHESLYTRWYQGYLLPRKFGIDKRKVHWANLIHSGQATREEALGDLATEPYPIASQKEDSEFVRKKLRLGEGDWLAILAAAPCGHEEYPNREQLFRRIKALLHWLRARGLYPK